MMKAARRFLCAILFALASTRGAEPALGTYHWPNGTAGVDAFAAWLGRDAVWGLDFVGGESWSNVGWPVFWLEAGH